MKRFSETAVSFEEVISSSKNKLLQIIMNWESIVGKGNHLIMMPLKLEKKTLSIAVPNNIVLSASVKFTHLIAERINAKFGAETVQKVNFQLDPSKFKGIKNLKKTKISASSESRTEEDPISLIPEEKIIEKKEELKKKFGFSDAMALSAAKIELMIKNKNNINKLETNNDK